MTLNQLIAEAKKIKGWRLNGNEIRCKRGYCPVVAVANKRSPDDHFLNEFYRSAAASLKLRDSVADRVATAADEDEEILTVKEALLRRRLIEELIPRAGDRRQLRDASVSFQGEVLGAGVPLDRSLRPR